MDRVACPRPRENAEPSSLVQRRIPGPPRGPRNIVTTVKPMHVSIRQIGNSQGVVIPKPILTQVGLSGEAGAEMTIERDALVLRRKFSLIR